MEVAMSNDSLKEKAQKFLLGMGITAVVGCGIVGAKKYLSRLESEQNNEKANKEWKLQYADADSTYADAATAHFYAKKNADKNALDSLAVQMKSVQDKISELEAARAKIEKKAQLKLFKAAKSKNAQKYLSVLSSMKEDGIPVDFNQEQDGISLNDLLQANAQGSDVRWVAINRKKESGKRISVEDAIVVRDDKGGFVVTESGVKGLFQKRFTLKDIAKKSSTSVTEIAHDLAVLKGVENLLKPSIQGAKGYEIEANSELLSKKETTAQDGKVVEKELPRKFVQYVDDNGSLYEGVERGWEVRMALIENYDKRSH